MRAGRWTSMGVGVMALASSAACGGSTGAVTGEPLREDARTADPPVVATTTTVQPRSASPSGDVVSEFDRLMAIRVECGRRPRTCPVNELTVDGSTMRAELSDLMATRSESGIVASTRGSLRYRIDGARVEGDVAMITTCLYDDIVLTMDGSIFDESTTSAITEWTMVRTADGWKWSDWRTVTSTKEGDLCGFVD